MKRICLLLEALNEATTAVNERIGQTEKAGGIITDVKFQPRPPFSSRVIFCIATIDNEKVNGTSIVVGSHTGII
jgi:hypothetical protein